MLPVVVPRLFFSQGCPCHTLESCRYGQAATDHGYYNQHLNQIQAKRTPVNPCPLPASSNSRILFSSSNFDDRNPICEYHHVCVCVCGCCSFFCNVALRVFFCHNQRKGADLRGIRSSKPVQTRGKAAQGCDGGGGDSSAPCRLGWHVSDGGKNSARKNKAFHILVHNLF